VKRNALQTLKEIEDGILEVRNLIDDRQMLRDQDLVDTKLHNLEMKAANMRVMINLNGELDAI
tara:strand:+ start:3597 stop:3785 length:189 start_codon:yes stop_codon:yes gene_type:complete